MISIPQFLFKAVFTLLNTKSTERHFNFNIVFTTDLYKDYEHYIKQTLFKECLDWSRIQFRSCLNFSALHKTTADSRYYIMLQSRNSMSWNYVSSQCKSLGGKLPHFVNRKQSEELLALLKLLRDFPPVQGLFINLKYQSRHKVSTNI